MDWRADTTTCKIGKSIGPREFALETAGVSSSWISSEIASVAIARSEATRTRDRLCCKRGRPSFFRLRVRNRVLTGST